MTSNDPKRSGGMTAAQATALKAERQRTDPAYRAELPPAGSVTMLFTDIEGSTSLADRLGDRYPELLAAHHQVLRTAIEATGGYEVSTAGDSFFVVFTDARSALECARHAQRLLASERWLEGESLRVRIGIHTGAPVIRDGTYVGIDVHCAARVMSVAHGGQVLITEAVRRGLPRSADVIDLGHHRLKDLPAPTHLFQLLDAELPAEFPPLRSLNNSNLPAPSHPLVGRQSEVATARQLLARSDVRLVTLLGPGGSGKTRLALEIAAETLPRYPDGVWFVSLAPIAEPSLLASEIARSLGIAEAEGQSADVTVAEALSRRELLLVLDNFEHLLAAARLVGELLAAAPRLDVLATSREPLHLRGEHRMEVPPLPPADAAELFLQRARAIRPDLRADAKGRQVLGRICLRLDGLPLALELAAARVALFSLPALEARLAQRLNLPEGPRDVPDPQRTLRATIDWSYRLLLPEEQALFRDLALFAGGARLRAIESIITSSEAEPLEAIAALVDKSLLRRRDDPDGEPRFWMLETIREYASECLTAHGDAESVAARHAAHFVDLAQEGDRRIHTGHQRAWLERLEADHDNLRAAFDYLLVHEPSDSLRMAGALGDFWEIHGHLSEGRERLQRALASGPGKGAARAKASFLAGRFAFFQGEGDKSQSLLAEALRLAREAGETRVEVLALTHIGMVAQAAGQVTRSVELHEEGAIPRSCGCG